MLIRIAPEMFIDARFQCATIKEVRREIFERQKFKTKYQWRSQYRDKIITIETLLQKNVFYKRTCILIDEMIFSGKLNESTARLFDLSFQDRRVAAAAISLKYDVSTTDTNLINFLKQEFEIKNKFPLEIVNEWLTNKLIYCDEKFQSIIDDWNVCSEPPQPASAIRKFEQLSGYKYTGP